MREIKFRAWDTEKKEMIYPNTKSKVWDYFQIILKGEIYLYDTDDYGKTGLWEHNIDFKKGRFILMQSIGLKDKNGTEIYYDSDIVEYTYQIENDIEISEEVVIGTVVLDLEFTNSLCVKTKGGALYHFTASECRHSIEIIHQNKELLEKENA